MKKISKITQMLLHKHSQAFFKSSFPRIEADLSIIKNDIISGQPDDPAGSDKISLKILLPKASLASITISNGYKFRFQLIEIKFQQLSLTERTLSLFLHVRYGIEHNL